MRARAAIKTSPGWKIDVSVRSGDVLSLGWWAAIKVRNGVRSITARARSSVPSACGWRALRSDPLISKEAGPFLTRLDARAKPVAGALQINTRADKIPAPRADVRNHTYVCERPNYCAAALFITSAARTINQLRMGNEIENAGEMKCLPACLIRRWIKNVAEFAAAGARIPRPGSYFLFEGGRPCCFAREVQVWFSFQLEQQLLLAE